MLELEYEMTYREKISGPLGSTKGAPLGERLCWLIESGTLTGPRINAKIIVSGTDWVRLGPDGIRRQDLRAQLITDDGALLLFHYDTGLIRSSETFIAALASDKQTAFSDQYMRMVPEFEVGDERYAWLNQSIFLARGRLAGHREIEYEIFRVD